MIKDVMNRPGMNRPGGRAVWRHGTAARHTA
jgi:hypothetical protein